MGWTEGVEWDIPWNQTGPGRWKDEVAVAIADHLTNGGSQRAAALLDPPARREAKPQGEENPQAPQRGWAARLLGRFHVTGVFWYKFHAFGATLPSWMASVIIPLFVSFFFVALRSIRRAVASNLEAVQGPCGWWRRQVRIWKSFYAFAWSQTERYERLLTDREFHMEGERWEVWEQAVGGPLGVVLVTGHVGNWEMASTLPEARGNSRLHVVREEEMDPEAQAFVSERLARRTGDGYVTHFASGVEPSLGVKLYEALTRGEVVALQGDRPRKQGRSVPVTFLGRAHRLPAGPLALARQAGVPLVPAFVFRTGRRAYRIRFSDPVRVSRTADRRGDLEAAGQQLADHLGAAVRHRPHQWFAFRELWP